MSETTRSHACLTLESVCEEFLISAEILPKATGGDPKIHPNLQEPVEARLDPKL